jgi:hypothetical protein
VLNDEEGAVPLLVQNNSDYETRDNHPRMMWFACKPLSFFKREIWASFELRNPSAVPLVKFQGSHGILVLLLATLPSPTG